MQLGKEERKNRPGLVEILASRKQQYNPSKEQLICSRCRHNKATITIGEVCMM